MHGHIILMFSHFIRARFEVVAHSDSWRCPTRLHSGTTRWCDVSANVSRDDRPHPLIWGRGVLGIRSPGPGRGGQFASRHVPASAGKHAFSLVVV
jgi:hypothetical protein